jgi:hypothetical protein
VSDDIGIFYLAYRAGPGRIRLTLPNGRPPVYIRCEIVDSAFASLDDALQEAKPRHNEEVMNSHYLVPLHEEDSDEDR